MLHEAFYWLACMSITGAICGLAVMLMRLIPKIPRRVSVLFWLIPLIRLTVPFGIKGKWTLMDLTAFLHSREIPFPALDGAFSSMNHVGAAQTHYPIDYRTETLRRVFEISGIIWLIGAAALVIAFFLLYFASLKELKDATPRGDIFYSPKINCPAVYGVFKPRIILPEGSDAKELVVLHERTHIKRLDNLFRIIAFITAAIHWFNPLAWVFLKHYLADTELACDEAVLAKCGEERKKDYATALLSYAESKNAFVSAFGGAAIRTRIEKILNYKKLTLFSAVILCIFVFAVFYVLLVN